jgi:hypothetical protein
MRVSVESNKGGPGAKPPNYLEDGTPIEYFEAWHRGDRCKFAIELVPAEEMKKRMPAHRENSTFWSGIPSKQAVSLSGRTDK